MNTDQPNLQDLLFTFSWDTHLVKVENHNSKLTDEEASAKYQKLYREAIDAIYAGLLAEVIGEDYPYMQSEGNTSSYDFIPMAKNALKVEQRESLKRWCYGENTSNDKQEPSK